MHPTGCILFTNSKKSILSIHDLFLAIARLDVAILSNATNITAHQINAKYLKKTPNNAKIARCSSRYRLLFALSTTIVLDSLFDCLFRKHGTVYLLRRQTFQYLDHLFVGKL